MDAFGDHAYSCRNVSKHSAHNRIRDSLFAVLQQTLPFTQLARSDCDIAREPTGLLPQQPNTRPADVAVRLAEQDHSHLCLDVTCISMATKVPSDPPALAVDRHHERHENAKFRRNGSVDAARLQLQAMLRRKLLFVPFTVDPGGRIGPLAQQLLYPRNKSYPQPEPSSTRTSTALSLQEARQLCQDTLKSSPTAILAKADQGWRDLHGETPFHPNAALPSQWAHQTLALNITIALTLHLEQALSKLTPFSAQGCCKPLLMTGTLPLKRAHYPHIIPTKLKRVNRTTWDT